jgi:site-specific recombinase XerD
MPVSAGWGRGADQASPEYSGRLDDDDRIHLQATFYHYLLFCQANKAASTHRIYRSTLWAFYRWWSQERPYETLGPTLLHAYKIWLCETRDQGHERLQARSINNYLAAVRALCRWIQSPSCDELGARPGDPG